MSEKHYSAFVVDPSGSLNALRGAGVPDKAAKEAAKAAAKLEGPLNITVVDYGDHTAASFSKVQLDFDPTQRETAASRMELESKMEALETQVAALLARLDG